jgi:hypothetical protein
MDVQFLDIPLAVGEAGPRKRRPELKAFGKDVTGLQVEALSRLCRLIFPN